MGRARVVCSSGGVWVRLGGRCPRMVIGEKGRGVVLVVVDVEGVVGGVVAKKIVGDGVVVVEIVGGGGGGVNRDCR